jgi:hypothetical protein
LPEASHASKLVKGKILVGKKIPMKGNIEMMGDVLNARKKSESIWHVLCTPK